MWTQGQENRWFYYICSSRRRGGTCPDQSYAPMALVHEQVERLIRQIQLPTDWQQRIVELANYKEEIKDVERARAQVQGNITRLTNAYIWQGTDEETYQAELRQLQGRLARLQVPDTPAVVQAGTYLESLAGLWDDLDDRERREVVHILFQEIRLDVKGKNSKIICVQVKPDFVPLFRLDGMEEGDNGCFYLSGPD